MDVTLLEESVDRLLSQQCGPEARQAAEEDGWAPTVWDALASSGFTMVGVPEAVGGAGGNVADACAVIRMAGRHAVPLPLAECTLLGGWLAGEADLPIPEGPITVAVPRASDRLELDGGRLAGHLGRVPWGERSAAVVAVADSPDGPRVVVADPSSAIVTPGLNLAGERRDDLVFDGVELAAETVGDAPTQVRDLLRARGALSRALLLAGATEAVSEMTIAYAGERQQFGKPVATFQAVAHRMVRLASEAEAAGLAAAVASARLAKAGGGVEELIFEMAVAKASASRAAAEVAVHAHQIHGAIGMTREYPLHHFTRRIWAWCQEWGTERQWCRQVGAGALEAGSQALWPRITRP